jgi:HEAT repeat protein
MNPKDVSRLLEELRHREPEEKLAWIRELAQNPTDESIEVLLSVLEQESWFLRDQAVRALATLGERVVEPLIDYLGSGLWYTRACAAGALGRMGVPLAAGPLVGLLRDANRTVRDAARDREAAGGVGRAMEEQAQRGPERLRAVNQSDELSWEDVVGGGGKRSSEP